MHFSEIIFKGIYKIIYTHIYGNILMALLLSGVELQLKKKIQTLSRTIQWQ
jgi:hypothetical protein